MLPTTSRLKFDLYQHEIICADVCSAYWGKFDYWSEPYNDTLAGLKLEPDRGMGIGGLDIFWEIDRGTEAPRILWEKMVKYRQYSQIVRKPFHVVFVIQDYAKDIEVKLYKGTDREAARIDKQKKRIREIERLSIEARCGNLFLFTCQDWIIKYPQNTVLASPTGATYSFETLLELYK